MLTVKKYSRSRARPALPSPTGLLMLFNTMRASCLRTPGPAGSREQGKPIYISQFPRNQSAPIFRERGGAARASLPFACRGSRSAEQPVRRESRGGGESPGGGKGGRRKSAADACRPACVGFRESGGGFRRVRELPRSSARQSDAFGSAGRRAPEGAAVAGDVQFPIVFGYSFLSDTYPDVS